MQSKAATVAEYIAALPEDRRAAISALRKVIRANLDKDYEEGIQYGMIGYYVPHRVFSAGYHCDPKQPLPFASLASQKGHMSIYLMCVYGDGGEAAWFKAAWAKTGKKLDMGKSCVRFKKLEDVPLDVIGEAIRRVPAKLHIERCQAALSQTSKGKKAAAAEAKKQAKPAATVNSVTAKPAAKAPAKKPALAAKPAAKAPAKKPARRGAATVS